MEQVGYYNGTLGKLEEIQCPILDRAVYFGDGCYDATYVQNGVIFALEDHFDRFYNSCRLLRIPFQYSREELKEILYKLVEVFDGNDGKGIAYAWNARETTDSNGNATYYKYRKDGAFFYISEIDYGYNKNNPFGIPANKMHFYYEQRPDAYPVNIAGVTGKMDCRLKYIETSSSDSIYLVYNFVKKRCGTLVLIFTHRASHFII